MVHGWDVNIHRAEVSSPQGGMAGERSVIFHRVGEGSTSTELRCTGKKKCHPPNVQSMESEGGTKRCHPPRSGGAQCTGREGGREGGTDKVSTFAKLRCTVHMEGRRGVNIHRAEVSGPQGRRVGGRGIILHRTEVYGPQGEKYVSSSTESERGQHPQTEVSGVQGGMVGEINDMLPRAEVYGSHGGRMVGTSVILHRVYHRGKHPQS